MKYLLVVVEGTWKTPQGECPEEASGPPKESEVPRT